MSVERIITRKPRLPGPNVPRAHATVRTNRPVEFDELPGLEFRSEDGHGQVLATVRSGAVNLLKKFLRRAKQFGLNVRDDGADRIASSVATGDVDQHSGERSRKVERIPIVGRTGPELRIVETLGPDDSRTRTQFLVWGPYAKLIAFLKANTGRGKPIVKWELVERKHVAMGSGQSPVTDKTRQQLRERRRYAAARAERADRELELRDSLDKLHTSNPDSPYHADEQRRMEQRVELIYGMLFSGESYPDAFVQKLHTAIGKVLREKERNGENWTAKPMTRSEVFKKM